METLIAEIVQKLNLLTEVKILEVLDFVDFLSAKQHLVSQSLGRDGLTDDDEFEAIADHLADELELSLGSTVPALSDAAVSRAGIYEEHP